MLKPINNVANRVVDGRRYASRSIVISKLSAIACFVFRRQTIPAVEGEAREETIWEGGQVLSDHEEHATEYVEQGYAMMVFDSFSGGSIHSDGDDINMGEALVYAQIEPFFFENYPNKSEMLRNVPDWKPKKGDVFGLVISENLIKWLECVGVTGQSVHASHGERYALNVRDSLMHLDPFKNHQDLMLPQANIFPIELSALSYSKAPIYDFDDKDNTDLSDDSIRVKVFKMVNFTDKQVENYFGVLPVKHMANKTQSPYFLSEDDQAKVTVDIGAGEQFILTSDSPVKAIETSLGNFSNMLFMIDHVAVVDKIKNDLQALKAVVVEHNGKVVFEILPTLYDEVRKAYHFVLFVQFGAISTYNLKFQDGTAHELILNAEAVEVFNG